MGSKCTLITRAWGYVYGARCAALERWRFIATIAQLYILGFTQFSHQRLIQSTDDELEVLLEVERWTTDSKKLARF